MVWVNCWFALDTNFTASASGQQREGKINGYLKVTIKVRSIFIFSNPQEIEYFGEVDLQSVEIEKTALCFHSSDKSHFDFFTYDMVAMDLISIVGNFFYLLRCPRWHSECMVGMVGLYFFSIFSPGPRCYHLTGSETFRWGHITNIITGCVWFMCCFCLGLTKDLVIIFSSVSAAYFLVFSFIDVSFCSLSVVCVLICPRPGDGGRKRERVDQLKQRAVNTILAMLGALLLSFVGILTCTVLHSTTGWEMCGNIVFSLVLSPQQSGGTTAVSTPGRKTSRFIGGTCHHVPLADQ